MKFNTNLISFFGAITLSVYSVYNLTTCVNNSFFCPIHALNMTKVEESRLAAAMSAIAMLCAIFIALSAVDCVSETQVHRYSKIV